MRRRSSWLTTCLIAGMLLVVGCDADRSGVDAASDILPVSEPLAELAGVEQRAGVGAGDRAAASGAVDSGSDAFGVIGLLAPALSAPGIETYTTSCDPFEDPYGACL